MMQGLQEKMKEKKKYVGITRKDERKEKVCTHKK